MFPGFPESKCPVNGDNLTPLGHFGFRVVRRWQGRARWLPAIGPGQEPVSRYCRGIRSGRSGAGSGGPGYSSRREIRQPLDEIGEILAVREHSVGRDGHGQVSPDQARVRTSPYRQTNFRSPRYERASAHRSSHSKTRLTADLTPRPRLRRALASRRVVGRDCAYRAPGPGRSRVLPEMEEFQLFRVRGVEHGMQHDSHVHHEHGDACREEQGKPRDRRAKLRRDAQQGWGSASMVSRRRIGGSRGSVGGGCRRCCRRRAGRG